MPTSFPKSPKGRETLEKQDFSTAERAIELAEKLLVSSFERTTPVEEKEMQRLTGLVADPASKRLAMGMTDRFWRSGDASRIAQSWRNLLRKIGTLSELGFLDRLLISGGVFGSHFLPDVVVSQIRQRLRLETARVILPADEPRLGRFLEKGTQDFRASQNINQLGESVLGEGEASRRLERLLELLERGDVSHVSIKISAIFSQINVLAWEDTLDKIKERLRRIYRIALREKKFVNLDMEEYRDLALTVEAFCGVLVEPEFLSLTAGLVLQAYLPDSIGVQKELTAWARMRVDRGGAPIRVRLVKGANLAMEQVEAEWHGWNSAPFPTKLHSDASFKRMLEYALRPENTEAVRIGIGSHNLFDVALAITLARDANVESAMEIEMLEGMSSPQARAVMEEIGGLLLYCPIVHEENFGSALAYLVRRLDENTAPANFLTHIFSMTPDSETWKDQETRFLDAWLCRDRIDIQPRRSQPTVIPDSNFINEPDTDWTQKPHRLKLNEALSRYIPPALPSAIDLVGADSLLASVVSAQVNWEKQGVEARAKILRRCADEIRRQRFDTIATLTHEGKKAAAEADTEISEAIDFAHYYADLANLPEGVEAQAIGTVVIAPPWNFPYAIPCGGVLAALVAGNSVILKPAPETKGICWLLARQLWAAGVPLEVLQFANCPDGDASRKLITDPRTSAVILTGAWETANLFREWRPSLKLFAETSGKNAIVVSAMADRELAARDLVRSAFSHAGQKCSAASLGILETEVYNDPVFRRQLRDAAESLSVGAAENLSSVVTPLIRPPSEALERALTSLDEGEEWLLKPRQDSNDPCLWSPGIKIGVKPGSWFHQTECFGPVLGLMQAHDLKEAVRLQNGVEFGLTAGFQSLDEDEISWWSDRVEAGNLYINRGITGAIVRRQAFGGWKQSCIGPGAKAGGPNYVNQFRVLSDENTADDTIESAAANYKKAWRQHFSKEHDPSELRCESNDFRYHRKRGVILRLEKPDPRSEALAKLASGCCGVRLRISYSTEESAAQLSAQLRNLAKDYSVLRTIGPDCEDDLLSEAARTGLNWSDAPLSANGEVELVRWMKEQVVTETQHRYGNCL